MDMDHPHTSSAEPLPSVAPLSRGRRPDFTDDPMLDRLYAVTLALVSELAVARTRLDTVERLLARRELLPTESIETYVPEPHEAEARARLHQQYLERVLRALREG